MKLLRTLTLALTLTSAALAADPVKFDWFEYSGHDTAFAGPLPEGHYFNPILAGYYPDPSICRAGDDYYLVNSSFGYYPGIPIHKSHDLVNWEPIGYVIHRPDQLNYDGMGVTRGIFAPAISYHDGVFYVLCTMVDGGGNFLVTATDPSGPWSDPIWLHFEGIDPSLFFDDTGKAYIVNNGAPNEAPRYQGHRAIWVQEFDIATRSLVGERTQIVNGGVDISKKPVWIEGPHLYKHNGWYFLCCAEGGTSIQHSQVILRSKSVTGPFVPWEGNPILTQRDLDGTVPGAITCTGHADLVVGPDGKWWASFLACRPFAKEYWLTGRETFLLPVTWTDDDWPLILPHGERVPAVVASPNGVSLEPGSPPLSGNFTWRESFDQGATKLPPTWFMLRTPKDDWWQLDGKHLNVVPRAEPLDGKGNPSLLVRRIQHAKFDATTRMSTPTTNGTSAGLTAFQNERHYYYFGVRKTEGGLSAVVELKNGNRAQTLITGLLPSADSIELRISGEETKISFAYSLRPGEWKTLLPDADALAISVQAAGGGLHFTGAVVGVHARMDQ